MSLSHPVRENRMIAVEILGRRHAEAALPLFEQMLSAENDVYLLREIVKALSRYRSEHATALLVEATKHRAKMVRDTARRALHHTE